MEATRLVRLVSLCRCCGKACEQANAWDRAPIHMRCWPNHTKHAHGKNASRCREYKLQNSRKGEPSLMIICEDQYHEDDYENGEVVPLRKEDVRFVNRQWICDYCYEERQDREQEEMANAPDIEDMVSSRTR